MPVVTFTRALERFVEAPTVTAAGTTLGETLNDVFATRPVLRGYVLDDQGALRRHVAVYVNGTLVRDRSGLSDPVGPSDEVFVLQALTGG
ncbi:MAG: MoaD/ThiS family protein [Rhodospirillales bacterium]